MSHIPAQLITEGYLLDPGTEDIAFSGHELEQGMVVLIEDPRLRGYSGTPLETLHTSDRRHYLECARWCKIERLSIQGSEIRFVGVYADGSKCVRSYNTIHSWIFKLDSASE